MWSWTELWHNTEAFPRATLIHQGQIDAWLGWHGASEQGSSRGAPLWFADQKWKVVVLCYILQQERNREKVDCKTFFIILMIFFKTKKYWFVRSLLSIYIWFWLIGLLFFFCFHFLPCDNHLKWLSGQRPNPGIVFLINLIALFWQMMEVLL